MWLRCSDCQGQQRPINPGGNTHDRTLTPSRARRRGRGLRRDRADAASKLAGFRRGPAGHAQAPGWYRYNVGSYQITVATDGKRSFKLPDTFVLNAKKDQVNEALLAAHMEKDMMTIPYSPIVINTGSKLIVVDTGVGEANFERSKGVSGQFQNNLKAAGIDRDKVDTVIISHFHGDHINGLIKPDGSPAYPNAEILVPAVEWKYFMDDGEMSRQTTDAHEGGVRRHAHGVRCVEAQGHAIRRPARKWRRASPRSRPTAIRRATCLMWSPPAARRSTCSPTSPTIRRCLPAIRAGTPSSTRTRRWPRQTRRKVYDMLVADKMMVQGFHYPFPSVAYVEKAGIGYREIPVMWNSSL